MTTAEIIWDEDLTSAYNLMENSSETIFLTGRAGTGKSTLLNYFRATTRKKHIVLAPTGLAAIQVGGSTIHSFFGFPLREMIEDDPEIKEWSSTHPRLKVLWEAEAIIIDEVSMVRADILDAIDQFLQLNMKSLAPFGGKQLIMIGDVFQLPPVVSDNGRVILQEDEDSPSPYFFASRVYRQCRPRIVELKKIHRQVDEDFIFVLNRLRTGIADESDLEVINSRFTDKRSDFGVTLTTTNSIAESVNNEELDAIIAKPFFFKGMLEGKFSENNLPAPKTLALKRGAQVMMVKNDPAGRWVNGSIGKVDSIDEFEIRVRFKDGSLHYVERVTWEHKTYVWDKRAHTITFSVDGTYRQFPLRLAWAMTIHKSQGLTFDDITIDLGKGAFAHGQLYVALSRCKTLDGIKLNRKILPTDMIIDESVTNFSRKIK